jgi:hypothetical protein
VSSGKAVEPFQNRAQRPARDGPRDAPLAAGRDLLPARRQCRHTVRREKTQLADAGKQLPVDLDLPVARERAHQRLRGARQAVPLQRGGGGAQAPQRHAQIVETLGLAALSRLSRALERALAQIPEVARFSHGALL